MKLDILLLDHAIIQVVRPSSKLPMATQGKLPVQAI